MSFGEKYAHFYDIFYQHKDYNGEVKFLEELFRRYGHGKTQRILDVACGTGNHLLRLLQLGYEVVGNDLSASMIDVCQQKLANAGLTARLYVSPMQRVAVKENNFDALIALFAVVDYLNTDEELQTAFHEFYTKLKLGGLLIFDFWNALVIPKNFDPYREKKFRADNRMTVTRISRTTLNTAKKIAQIHFDILANRNGKVEGFDETHLLRYFDEAEIRKFVIDAGFEILDVVPFFNEPGDKKNAWTLCLIAKKLF